MKKRSFVALLMTILMLASNMSVLAAEPAIQPSSDDVIVIDITDEGIQLAEGQDVDDNEVVIVNSGDNDGIMPLSAVRGYTCIHANASAGRKTITTTGGSSSYGYMQVAVREYTGNPEVNVVLYRPDGTYAGQIYLFASDGTKSIRFSSASAGPFTVAWGVEGSYSCDIDVWLTW